MSKPDIAAVEQYLRSLQLDICTSLEEIDGKETFRKDQWDRPGGGGGLSRVLVAGDVFEQAGVGFSHVFGSEMPPSATKGRPELAGKSFQAMGVSLVLHPRNPYIPTTHANFRFFTTDSGDGDPVWWFGGGFDLTPYYPFHEDVIHWHTTAREACAPFGDDAYPKYKTWCDEYFFLKHRNETRGVGGLFFDDLNECGLRRSPSSSRDRVGDRFLPAYLPIVKKRRKDHRATASASASSSSTAAGRYVEFNLDVTTAARCSASSPAAERNRS